MLESLTLAEKHDLKNLEEKITQGREGFVIVGLALSIIKEQRLYRAKHGTFEEYCQDRWGWSSQRAWQLIQSSEVVEALTKRETREAIQSERAARELAKVEKGKRDQVADEAAKNGAVTAGSVAQVMKKGTIYRPLNDEGGYPIPRALLDMWKNRTAISQLMHNISKIRTLIAKNRKDGDKLFLKVDQSVLDKLDSVYALLRQALPVHVCGVCQGRLELMPDECCKACGNTGFMSKYEYETFVPIEVRVARKRNETSRLPDTLPRCDSGDVENESIDVSSTSDWPRENSDLCQSDSVPPAEESTGAGAP